jgi:putative Holliday junction resolvase
LTSNSAPETNSSERASNASGRLVALDLGTKRVGVAVSDELNITTRPLPVIERRSWKDLLKRVGEIVGGYDARGLVIGLPINMDGSEGAAAAEARRLAENFRRSLNVPVYLQDERLTSVEAESTMNTAGAGEKERAHCIDSESAAIILRDFIASTK